MQVERLQFRENAVDGEVENLVGVITAVAHRIAGPDDAIGLSGSRVVGTSDCLLRELKNVARGTDVAAIVP